MRALQSKRQILLFDKLFYVLIQEQKQAFFKGFFFFLNACRAILLGFAVNISNGP